MHFIDVSVYPSFNVTTIQWTLEGDWPPTDFFFWVEKSESPQEAWNLITPVPIINNYLFNDLLTSRTAKEGHIYYRVKGKFNNTEIISEPRDLLRSLDKPKFLIVKEICRKEALRLQKFVGIKCNVYKRKHKGKLCPVCVQPIINESTNSRCTNCFGTSIEGGYYPPIFTFIEISPIQGTKKITDLGMAENFAAIARMANYPLISRGI